MLRPACIVAALVLLAGCQRTASETTLPASASADGPVPTNDAGTGMPYECADGSRVTLAAGPRDARLQRADGRNAILPRAESASSAGHDVYVGGDVSIEVSGDAVQLHDGKASTTCTMDMG